MQDNISYYLINKIALPEVLLKVVEAKKMLESEKAMTIQEAVDYVGISRSSFYKYKDTIFPFYDNARGKTITIGFKMEDKPGLLAHLLKLIATYNANILTIHQSIPINGVANLTLSVEVLPNTGNIEEMMKEIQNVNGVHQVKILARE
ncbi:MAG: ACT domain-containing protein [Eubacteriales bacterium]